MEEKDFATIFNGGILEDLFPDQRADQFFEALYGDLEEGAYTIHLKFRRYDGERKALVFGLELKERPGKCLACSLTYGLPQVFARHPVINIKGIVEEIEKLLGGGVLCREWSLGRTEPISNKIHSIPLTIQLA